MTVQAAYSKEESRKIALLIDHFVVKEYFTGDYYSSDELDNLLEAEMCLERAYGIRLYEIFKPLPHSLMNIFNLAKHPVLVKNRIAAKKHKEKGNEFMKTGKFDLAETEYTKSVDNDPKNAIYYCNRAAARVRLLMYASAVADCKKALKLDRNYAKAYGWLGIARALMNHPARAVRCYKKALEIEPDNEAYLANMELINRRMNRIVLKVLKPFFMCSRSFRGMTLTGTSDHQVKYHAKKNGETDEVEYDLELTCVIKYATEKAD